MGILNLGRETTLHAGSRLLRRGDEAADLLRQRRDARVGLIPGRVPGDEALVLVLGGLLDANIRAVALDLRAGHAMLVSMLAWAGGALLDSRSCPTSRL